jgi:hypothetical protein
MNFPTQSETVIDAGARKAEETLRLIARMPAPAGLEDRVKARLESAPGTAQLLFWPSGSTRGDGWLRGNAARAAAAAAIVFVVAGGSWRVYSHVQPAMQPKVIVMPPRVNGAGGFSSAGAMRTPQTLNGPVLTHQAHQDPEAADNKPGTARAQKKSDHAKTTSSKGLAAQPGAR